MGRARASTEYIQIRRTIVFTTRRMTVHKDCNSAVFNDHTDSVKCPAFDYGTEGDNTHTACKQNTNVHSLRVATDPDRTSRTPTICQSEVQNYAGSQHFGSIEPIEIVQGILEGKNYPTPNVLMKKMSKVLSNRVGLPSK